MLSQTLIRCIAMAHITEKPIWRPKRKNPASQGARPDSYMYYEIWRRGPESNRPGGICSPLHNRFATAP